MITRQQLRNYPACAVFNYSNAYITTGANTGITGNAAFSIACVVNSAIIGSYGTAVSFGTSVANGDVVFGLFGDMLCIQGYSDAYWARTTYKLPISTYLEIVATFAGGAGGAVNLYVNGALVASGTANASLNIGASKLYIGTGPNYYWGGTINDVRLWNVALTPAQVQAMYQTGVPPYVGTANLVRRYLLTEGAGTTPVDSSVNADTSTSTGLAWSGNTWMQPRTKITTPRALITTPRALVSGPPGVVTIAQADGTANSIITAGSSAGYVGVGGMVCWVSTPAFVNAQVFFEITDGTTSNAALLSVSGSNSLEVYSTGFATTVYAATVGAWHYWAVTFTSAGWKVWLDGVVIASSGSSAAMSFGATPAVKMLGSGPYARVFNGRIAVPALFSSLSQSDVTALFNGAAPSTRATHIWSLPMQDPVGSTTLAHVGAGNDATLGSTTVLL